MSSNYKHQAFSYFIFVNFAVVVCRFPFLPEIVKYLPETNIAFRRIQTFRGLKTHEPKKFFLVSCQSWEHFKHKNFSQHFKKFN